MQKKWWHDRVAYQVWPRSFMDGNGDGIGDLPGLISRLDHLEWLGIGILWLSPVYASPMRDMGYDISDYRDIAPDFGTLADMDRLIAEARRRDIAILMDLVVNHTSDQHRWFRAAKASREAPTRDFYVWADPAPDGGPPSPLPAYFGGPAWHWSEETGQYWLGVFSPFQPDLNWDNPALRDEIFGIMNWWLDRGIAGFRMDVIDHVGKTLHADRIETGTPATHRHLREMQERVFRGRDTLTVGEAWTVTPDTALDYVGRARGELDMVFQFAHITGGWDETRGKWAPKPFDLVAFKRVWADWQRALAKDGWNALFLSNHDLPRQVSRYGDGSPESAKALALAMHGMKGTPFIYQGEEIGMPNAGFERLDQYRDLETLNLFREQTERGMPADEFLAGAAANGRDNARTPVQWEDGPGVGFTTDEPWILPGSSAGRLSVAAQKGDSSSVLAFYRRLVALRREIPALVHGDFELILPDDPQIFAYHRNHEGRRLTVMVNLSPAHARHVECPSGETVIATSEASRNGLGPWQGLAVLA